LFVRNKTVNHKSTECNRTTEQCSKKRKIRTKRNSHEVQNFWLGAPN